MSQLVRVTIECTSLPPAEWGGHDQIWLGVQKGKDVEQAVKLPQDVVSFELELRVEGEADQLPNFLGPFAQGTSKDRFLYLCWGAYHQGQWHGFRRAKLPLAEITWDMIRTGHLVAKLNATDAKGGPICATVKGDRLKWSGEEPLEQ